MARSQLISAVNFVTLLFVAIPISVDSVLYKLVFDPSKFMIDCKDTKNSIYDVFDFTKLNVTLSDDNKMQLTGNIAAKDDYDANFPLSIYQSAKQKVRGRWVETPFRSVIKDLCAVYYKNGAFWYEKITKFFVGEERNCPPKKDTPLPINTIVEVEYDLPMRVAPGEYIARTVMKYKDMESCFDSYFDLKE